MTSSLNWGICDRRIASESGENSQGANEAKLVIEQQAMPANWYSDSDENEREGERDSEQEDEVTDSHISGDELAMLLDIEDQEKES